MAKRRMVARWALLAIGLLRVVLGAVVPVAEGRAVASTAAEWKLGGHIEESSRPECAPPHHEDCALCAHLWGAVEGPEQVPTMVCEAPRSRVHPAVPDFDPGLSAAVHGARGPPALN